MQQYTNTVNFEIEGEYALFSDPITRVGGEKYSYQIPPYDAIRGICESIYWKPTFNWIIDEVRVMNQIRTEAKGIRTLKYNKSEAGLSYYTYLKEVRYQVKAHFEWNMARPDLVFDRIDDKHYQIALRKIKEGGRFDIFLGTRECQAYVLPKKYGEDTGYYDKSGTIPFGLMYHGIIYPDKNQLNRMYVNFWEARMSDGIIQYPRPDKCTLSKEIIRKKEAK